VFAVFWQLGEEKFIEKIEKKVFCEAYKKVNIIGNSLLHEISVFCTRQHNTNIIMN